MQIYIPHSTFSTFTLFIISIHSIFFLWIYVNQAPLQTAIDIGDDQNTLSFFSNASLKGQIKEISTTYYGVRFTTHNVTLYSSIKALSKFLNIVEGEAS